MVHWYTLTPSHNDLAAQLYSAYPAPGSTPGCCWAVITQKQLASSVSLFLRLPSNWVKKTKRNERGEYLGCRRMPWHDSMKALQICSILAFKKNWVVLKTHCQQLDSWLWISTKHWANAYIPTVTGFCDHIFWGINGGSTGWTDTHQREPCRALIAEFCCLSRLSPGLFLYSNIAKHPQDCDLIWLATIPIYAYPFKFNLFCNVQYLNVLFLLPPQQTCPGHYQ